MATTTKTTILAALAAIVGSGVAQYGANKLTDSSTSWTTYRDSILTNLATTALSTLASSLTSNTTTTTTDTTTQQ